MTHIQSLHLPILLGIVLMLSSSAIAQTGVHKKNSIILYGNIMDSRTKAGVENVLVSLMTPDSVVLDTIHASTWNSSFNTRSITRYEFRVSREPAKYIVKGEIDGYQPAYVEKEVEGGARNHWLEMPIIKLHPIKKADEMEGNIDEVVVMATRIKMVHRGDTIIYNADAFNLEEGSMLRSLVKQLPGADLNSNGEIKVNGEKVEELTLNGHEFFNGNNNVMLENLPSFTVKNIKVYHKSSDISQYLGYEAEKKKLTMDVQLKREYNTGLLFNSELSIGTNDRYLGRLFAMRYTDCSRLSTFANTNNINNTNKPGEEGDWEPENNLQGQTKTGMGGLDLLIDEKEHRWRESANVIFHWEQIHGETKTNSEQYFSENNVYSRMMNDNENKNTSVSLHNGFQLLTPLFLVNTTDVSYSKGESTGLSRSSNADVSLERWGSVQSSLDSVFSAILSPELQKCLVNRNRSAFYSDNSSWNFSNTALVVQKIKNGDNISFDGSVQYNNLKHNNYTQQQVDYFRISDSNIAQNRYNTNPSHQYQYNLDATYTLSPTSTYMIELGCKYSQKYEMQNKEYYRLDRISGWGMDNANPIGSLPSGRNEMLIALDAANTYQGNYMNKNYEIELTQQWNNGNETHNFFARLDFPVIYSKEHLDYYSKNVNTSLAQNNFLLHPEGYFTFSLNKCGLNFSGNFNIFVSTPSLYKKVNVRNDENPLSVYLGNPNLKNSINENAEFTMHKQFAKSQITNGVTCRWSARQRDIAEGYLYDSTTGVYTFQPVNVDGNWDASVSDDIEASFGKSRQWSIRNNIGYDFVQNVDMASVEGETSATLSKVKTNSLTENVHLSYSLSTLTFGLNGDITYRHSTSDYKDMAVVNATNFSYGVTCNYRIPWLNATYATDIKMYSRRGYASNDFNTNDLVWNASLSKSLLKGKFTARLEAFDILHQLTNTNIVINAQGRTETIYNTLPRYVMLHLQWNLNKIPKKKQ